MKRAQSEKQACNWSTKLACQHLLAADFHISFGNLIMLLKTKQNKTESILFQTIRGNVFSNYESIMTKS